MTVSPDHDEKAREYRPNLVPPILIVGLVGTLAQILLLRELLALFQGNEPSAAAALGCWLLGTAAGSALASWRGRRRSPATAPLVCLLLLLTAALPGGLLLIRGSRLIWQVGIGELLPPFKMLAVAGCAAGLTGALCGALFARAWAEHGPRPARAQPGPPLAIYLAEAVGAAAAGPVFIWVLLPRLDAFQISLGGALVLLGGAAWLLRSMPGPAVALKAGWWLAAVLLVGLGYHHDRLERLSRIWQWGPTVVATADTAHHNLVLLREHSQWSLFGDGAWWFSVPDRQSAELEVLLPLLQHPRPRTLLLIGGCVSGRVEAALEHPGIEQIDCVEPDPGLLELIRSHFPPSGASGHPDRSAVHLHLDDPRRFLTRAPVRYDAILMAVGDPVNAGLNRFYSREFFELVARRLNPGGVFAFLASSGEDMMGGGQGGLLRSFHRTLAAVFARVLVVPGDQAQLLAGDRNTAFLTDPERLARRIDERGLTLQYLTRERFQDLFSPLRMNYLQAVLAADDGQAIGVNTDFLPACYRSALLLWAGRWSSSLMDLTRRLLVLPPAMVMAVLVAFGTGLVLWFRLRPNAPAAVHLAVLATGMLQLIVQILTLIGYQVLVGYLYTRLALIISAFMAGLALGTALASAWAARGGAPIRIRRALKAVQLLMVLDPLLLLLLFKGLHGTAAAAPEMLVTLLFSLFAGTAGSLGGAHFALAVLVCQDWTLRRDLLGGRLYALDIAGAMVGALAAPLLVIPVLGLIGGAAALSCVGLVVWLVLLESL